MFMIIQEQSVKFNTHRKKKVPQRQTESSCFTRLVNTTCKVPPSSS